MKKKGKKKVESIKLTLNNIKRGEQVNNKKNKIKQKKKKESALLLFLSSSNKKLSH
jgi:hypothetical protein